MAQLIGYSIGAAGPLAVGTLYELTDGWSAPMILVMAMAACIGMSGARAGREVTVGPAERPAG